MNDENILDKIIKIQEDEKKANFSPRELVNFVLKDLNQREREIINARYGLESEEPKTLEAIGKKYNITRERVRQIEKNALKKALNVDGLAEKMANLVSLVIKYIHQGGYLKLEQHLFDDILENSQEEIIDENRLRFIFKYFLTDYIELVDIVHTERAWKVKDKKLEHYEPVIEGVKNILEKKDEPLHLSAIIKLLEEKIVDEKIKTVIKDIENWEEAVNSYLHVSKYFKKNLFDKWGLAHWRLISPKRMRDKIYLILQKYKDPMHFRVIAEKINLEKFDNKLAHPATIHNELILDDRFVLIGRGTYALKDWGYQPGSIFDVIKQILIEADMPLTKDEITKEVLKRRQVKSGSINLVLSDRKLFEVLEDGSYKLKI